jgi:hypothetical protein
MEVRAVARAGIILGLAMAAIALVAATINPSDFHAQVLLQTPLILNLPPPGTDGSTVLIGPVVGTN